MSTLKLLSSLPETTLEKLLKSVIDPVEKDLKQITFLLENKHKGKGLDQNIADIFQEAITDHGVELVLYWIGKNTKKTVFIAKSDSKSFIDTEWCNKIIKDESTYKALEEYYGEKFEKTLLHKVKSENLERESLKNLINCESCPETIGEFVESVIQKGRGDFVVPFLLDLNKFEVLEALANMGIVKLTVRQKKAALKKYFKVAGDGNVNLCIVSAILYSSDHTVATAVATAGTTAGTTAETTIGTTTGTPKSIRCSSSNFSPMRSPIAVSPVPILASRAVSKKDPSSIAVSTTNPVCTQCSGSSSPKVYIKIAKDERKRVPGPPKKKVIVESDSSESE